MQNQEKLLSTFSQKPSVQPYFAKFRQNEPTTGFWSLTKETINLVFQTQISRKLVQSKEIKQLAS